MRKRNLVIFSIYLLILFYLSLLLSKKPLYNWDMLPYIAAAISMTTENIDSIHVQTYLTAKKETSEKTYEDLVTGSTYRETLSNNSEFFYQQLPLYTIKPLYVFSIYLLHYKMGFLLTTATYIPSIVSYFVIGLIVFFWIAYYLSFLWSLFLSVLILLFPPLLEVTRLSTPDALSTAVIFSALYFLVQKKSFNTCSILLLISIFVRLDNIIFTMILATFLKYFPKPMFKVGMINYLSVIICSIFIYLFIVWNVEIYTWQLAFVPQQVSPASFKGPISIGDYAAGLLRGVNSLQYSYFSSFIFILVLVRISSSIYMTIGEDTWFQLTLVIITSIVIKFFMFPTFENRFLLSFYLFSMVYFIAALKFKPAQSREAI